MAAPIPKATHVSNKVAEATTRGVTDQLALQKIRTDAADYWDSYINTSSGRPRGAGPD